jgi:hypothetical protein
MLKVAALFVAFAIWVWMGSSPIGRVRTAKGCAGGVDFFDGEAKGNSRAAILSGAVGTDLLEVI